ncbi:winged helix-turn-helix domain-containing protein [Glaciecola petra]|uniref:Winged helix-turn-helix domain-containing protein n=1 Tax=Glaciecola petra TaxID=3075602 RepID=A0ABU2ZR31_9ALTE|nr:winged helix-turn-helix domain-containing protein [Aestuariibacter sp. P117]MDT0595096.1 winged helix-turn-helix domain-containing protein [Aestuariibacter sp. P117]
MKKISNNKEMPIQFGDWEFIPSERLLYNTISSKSSNLEPKISELLRLLLAADGAVLSRESLIDSLWPNTIVSEDTLARTVSRLRSQLSDSANDPIYIKTIPKSGYQFLVSAKSSENIIKLPSTSFVLVLIIVVSVLVSILFWIVGYTNDDSTVSTMLDRADSLYMEFDEQSNESALALYEKVLNKQSNNARANAGVANALVQRVIRWPNENYSVEISGISLTSALSSGQLNTPDAKLMLERARLIAEKAVRESPYDVQALKSLGFVYSAEGNISRAIDVYRKAIEIDKHAWRSLINLGELYALAENDEAALATFINAYDAMQQKFIEEPQHVGPWQPELGLAIANRYKVVGNEDSAQLWANKVLELVPFERKASTLLVESLKRSGKHQEATRFCQNYAKKLEPILPCTNI